MVCARVEQTLSMVDLSSCVNVRTSKEQRRHKSKTAAQQERCVHTGTTDTHHHLTQIRRTT